MKKTFFDKSNKQNIIKIEYLFHTPIKDERKATVRALLSYMLVMSSKNYPNNYLLCRRLDYLYGASIETETFENPSNLGLSFFINFLDPKSLNDETYTFKSGLDMINEIIYNPNIINNKFDTNLFSQQKEELYINLLSDFEDKNYESYLKLKKILYKDKYINADGNYNIVKSITMTEVINEYYNMINNDDLIIRVYGNTTDNERKLIPQYSDKIKYNNKYLFDIPANTIYITDDYKGYESYLNMNYYTNVYLDNRKEALTLNLLSLMLTGDASSICYNEIREKRGLCYSISSIYNSREGILRISCEHLKKNTDEIINLVNKIINDISNGIFEDFILESARLKAIDANIKKMDSYSYNVVKEYRKEIYDLNYSYEDNIAIYKTITRDDITTMCKNLKLIICYNLRGILE